MFAGIADHVSFYRDTYSVSQFAAKVARHRAIERAFRRGDTVLDYPPEIIQVDPSGHCNLRCQMCPQGTPAQKPPGGNLSVDMARSIFEDAAASGMITLVLTLTGEPLINKQLGDIVSIAKATGLRVQLSTNGTLLTRERSMELIASGLDELMVSLDTAKKQQFEQYRVGASFDEVVENVRGFFAERRRARRRTPVVLIQNLVPQAAGKAPTIEPELAALFPGEKIHFRVKTFVNWAGQMPNTELYRPRGRRYVRCHTVYQRMVVAWDGTGVPCCDDMWKKYPTGSLPGQRVMDVWNGEPLVRLRRAHVERRYADIDLCRNCSALWT